jgi:hypothetical protein
MPALDGSPKQIAWAESIRVGIIKPLVELDTKIKDADLGLLGPVWPEFMAWMTGQTSASWWIDHRAISLGDALARAKDGSAEHTLRLAGMFLTGDGSATTWQDLWHTWLHDHHPQIVEQIKAEATAKTKEKARQAEIVVKELNEQCGKAAEMIREGDCTFDEYGNYKSATVDGHTYEQALYANHIGTIDGRYNGEALRRRRDCPHMFKLESAIASITAARRERIEGERRAAKIRNIRAGHATKVERSKKRDNNTTVTLDTGIELKATVARKTDNWGECFSESAIYGLNEEYHRIGLEAQKIYNQEV